MQYDQSEVPDLNESHFPDHLVTFIMPSRSIDAKKEKIEIATKELIGKTLEEKAHSHMPILHDIQHHIAYELHHTDSYELPSRQKRMGETLAKAWIDYREELRKLSNLKTPQAMIEAWPKRPDGDDVIPRLREALAQSMMFKSHLKAKS